MDRLADLLEQSNRAGISFLMTELETALLFLSVADTTRNEDSAVRNRDNALAAYQSVLRYQNRVTFDEADKITFDDQFAVVRASLLAVGFAL